jgi:hypothetical protein
MLHPPSLALLLLYSTMMLTLSLSNVVVIIIPPVDLVAEVVEDHEAVVTIVITPPILLVSHPLLQSLPNLYQLSHPIVTLLLIGGHRTVYYKMLVVTSLTFLLMPLQRHTPKYQPFSIARRIALTRILVN